MAVGLTPERLRESMRLVRKLAHRFTRDPDLREELIGLGYLTIATAAAGKTTPDNWRLYVRIAVCQNFRTQANKYGRALTVPRRVWQRARKERTQLYSLVHLDATQPTDDGEEPVYQLGHTVTPEALLIARETVANMTTPPSGDARVRRPRRARRTRRTAAETRALLLDAARRLFASRRDVSLSEVARAIGCDHSNVYRHFPTKRALLDAAMGR